MEAGWISELSSVKAFLSIAKVNGKNDKCNFSLAVTSVPSEADKTANKLGWNN